jgi:RNA polymerase sigma factor (sigma-70 family)
LKKIIKKEKTFNKFKIKNLTYQVVNEIKNDSKLFESLIKNNKGFIENIVLGFTNKTKAHPYYEDLFQCGLISMWKAIQTFDKTKANASTFSTFSYVVIRNDISQEIKKYQKKLKNEYSLENIKRRFNNENTAEYNETYFADTKQILTLKNFENDIVDKLFIQEKIKDFSNLEKQIYQYRFIENMSVAEVAKKVNKNFHLIKQILYSSIRPKVLQIQEEINR